MNRKEYVVFDDDKANLSKKRLMYHFWVVSVTIRRPINSIGKV